MTNKIKSLQAEEILDSRGNPTLLITAATENYQVSASVPSGASTGKFEAVELRDGDNKRFGGLGVKKAAANVNQIIAPAILNKNPEYQADIDNLLLSLDNTPDKANLGANSILGVSLAIARLGAATTKRSLWQHINDLADIKKSRPLPYLYANLINGGKHAVTDLAFQEYHLVPQMDNLEDNLNIIHSVQNSLKKILKANIGDEGGFVPNLTDVEEPLKLLMEAVDKSGFKNQIKLAMDVAASSFLESGSYKVSGSNMTADELIKLYKKMAVDYPLLSIEDPFGEEDFDNFAKLKSAIKPLIVGDDLTVTNKTRLQEAIDKNSIGAVIIKPNQIGTLTETLTTMKLARDNDIECVISHRSGETNDSFIVDLAIATGAFGIKLGAMQRGERIAKYNRLITIK
ncbi:MAG: enolase C-terminal domain-like protein [bacterium]|nr:enolase C-terminal domain-like protein [bacterium]